MKWHFTGNLNSVLFCVNSLHGCLHCNSCVQSLVALLCVCVCVVEFNISSWDCIEYNGMNGKKFKEISCGKLWGTKETYLPRGKCLFLGTFGAKWGGLQVPMKLRTMLVGPPSLDRSQLRNQTECVPQQWGGGGGPSRSAAPTFLGRGANHPHTGKQH
jgi:hypothetical protein